ncbi:hypothetical protein [Intestinimonas butyriciproducens]|uniref:hypothetical protein n=1 Tax=Intestinimonas butyriciproducens TaxID=1297617 RepID=UPI00189FCC26|nr:hypothetical protein [Intestinimonas butyriciproducens]
MRRKTKFYIDHIGISSKDFFDKPGFCMGNFYKTPLDRPYVPDRYYSGHYSPEQLITALKPLDTVQDVVKQYLDPNHTSDTVLLDKDAYEEEFWVDAPNVISNFVALEFTGGGLDDIMEFAVDHQIRYFVQGAKIYVDARKEAGLFLILA